MGSVERPVRGPSWVRWGSIGGSLGVHRGPLGFVGGWLRGPAGVQQSPGGSSGGPTRMLKVSAFYLEKKVLFLNNIFFKPLSISKQKSFVY